MKIVDITVSFWTITKSNRSIYRRMKEREEYEEIADESCESSPREIEQMGCFGWRPRFLECCNKPALFATTYALSQFFKKMPNATLSISLPTLETVFNISSLESSLIFLAVSISATFGALLLGNYFSARKTRWIGSGLMLVVFGLCLACLPTHSLLSTVSPGAGSRVT